MRKKTSVPSYQSIMYNVVCALKNMNGKASNKQVLYKILLDLDINLSGIKKAKNSVDWAGVYLRKLGFLETDSPKGVWVLKEEYFLMDDTIIKDLIKSRYKEFYGL